MGLLKDAQNLGYITQDQYDELAVSWSELGYDAYHSSDVEALQKMMQDFLDMGFLDLASAVFTEYDSAISFYEDMYNSEIYYDIGVSRWRDVETGRFVGDPYAWQND